MCVSTLSLHPKQPMHNDNLGDICTCKMRRFGRKKIGDKAIFSFSMLHEHRYCRYSLRENILTFPMSVPKAAAPPFSTFRVILHTRGAAHPFT